MAFDRHDNLYVCIGGMGLYRVTPERKVEKAHRRDQPQPARRSTTTAACASPTISTSPTTAASSSPRRRSATRCTNGPVDGLEARGNGRIICYDPNTGTTHTVLRDLQVPERHLHRQRRPVDPVRRDLGLPRQALLVRRAEEGHGRDRHREPAGLSRQHQPRLGRQLLAGAGRHALRRRSISPGRCRASAGAWPSACRATNGCSRTSTPAACSSSTSSGEVLETLWDLGGENHPMITSMREHQRLPLPRRHHEQPHRPAASSPAPIRTSSSTTGAGGKRHDRRARASLDDRLLGRGDAAITVPSFDGALKPNQHARRGRGRRRAARRRTDLAERRQRRCSSPTACAVLRFDAATAAPRPRGRTLRRHGHRARLPARRRPRGRARRRARCASSAAPHDGRRFDAGRPAARCMPSTRIAPTADGRCSSTDGSRDAAGRRLEARPDGARPQRPRCSSIDLADGAGARARRGLAYAFGVCAGGRRRPGVARAGGIALRRARAGGARRDRARRDLPGYPSRLRAGRGRRLLAHRVRAAHAARRVRAARAGLPRAHDGGDRAGVLDRADAELRATASSSRCRART